MLVEAGVDGALLVFLLAVAAERDQSRAIAQLRADLPRDLVAVDARQPDVDQDDVGLELHREFDAADAVTRLMDLMPGAFEQYAHHLAVVSVVLDDQNAVAGRSWRRLDPHAEDARRV